MIPENLINKTIAHYKIIELLGQGGMAIVYKAEDTKLNRIIVLKILLQHFTFDTQFVNRFIREAKTTATLEHPNIVRIYDVGEDNGIYYIAMEYLKGKTLQQMISLHGPLSSESTLNIIKEVANALQYAHSNGIIHRDIKPSNIFVCENGRIVLTDFGIAKSVEGTKLTRTGTFIGTPEYISPEQAKGEHLDNRSDLYSLGIVMFEMLTGRIPFEADTPIAIALKHINEIPKKLSELNTDIPPETENIVTKLIEKQPHNRFQTANELIEAIIKIEREPTFVTPLPIPVQKPKIKEPISIPPPTPVIEKKQVIKERKASLRWGLILLCVCIFIICYLSYYYYPSLSPQKPPTSSHTWQKFKSALTPPKVQHTWQKTYGGSDRDEAHSIQQTSDGGYIVAGYTYSL